MKLKKLYTGEIHLGNTVDVTDPCYHQQVRCRSTLDNLLPGAYECYAFCDNNHMIWYSRIVHHAYAKERRFSSVPLYQGEKVADIGVDSGLAGFFDHKPDFEGSAWEELCHWMFHPQTNHTFPGVYQRQWDGRDGFWTSAGEGDGGYEVFAVRNDANQIIAVEICFLLP